ncbi:hypothetical protein [Halalkalibacter flavus]|uniref:hypothetical protein n=1 Tax=Halalkalibacter flavus TaxID=3090668 RepID=UPI002FCBA11F
MKQVSFSLFLGQAEAFKSKVDSSVQSKILRNYVLNDYQLPGELSIINEGDKKGLKPEKFHFDENTDARLNELVKIVREAGYKANRSSLMRHIMNQLLEKLKNQNDSLPKKREVRHSSFYFEKGTKDVLEQFIPFRDRNAAIERFILEEYKPIYDKAVLLDKPEESESMRVSMSADAFEKLNRYVDEISTKGVTRTALMRDVVEQLISKLSNADARKLIAEVRLQHALREYEEAFDGDVLRERLSQYRAEKEE